MAILQPERVVAVVTWGVESKVRDALRDITVPAGCPKSLLFVPESGRTSVLQWGHSSSLACHPGATRTHRLIKQRFWWPSMVRDARRFVSACPICATGKGSNRPPAGLLQPLSVPSRPWSHIAMDFVTGLPLSDGKTVVLTVVDRFSKATHFIPLPKLPSARETATIVLDHVFRIHGLLWSLTGVPSLCQSFGQSSVDSWERPRACPLDITRRLMVRLSGRTKIWRGFFAVWRLPNRHLGVPG